MQCERCAATEPNDIDGAILGRIPLPVRGEGSDHFVHAVAAASAEESADDASRLAEARADAGLVLFQLAARIGVSRRVEREEVIDVRILVYAVAVGILFIPGPIE